MTSGSSSADAEKYLLHLIAAQDPLLCAAQNLPSGLLEILNIHPVHVSSSNKPTGTVRAKEGRKEETQRTNRMDSTCRGAPQIGTKGTRVLSTVGEMREQGLWSVGVKHLGCDV